MISRHCYSENHIHGRFRCEDGNLMRHDPQHDDPYLETNVGQCPECRGKGCPDPIETEIAA